jgi:uncharacterized membrane protein
MKAHEFLAAVDDDRVLGAVRAAERGTSAEILVYVSRRGSGGKPVEVRAQEAFVRLGIGRTEGRSGVLVFVAPVDREFSVLGDEAVHAKCGRDFWEKTAAVMEGHFREGRFTEGLVAGVGRAGELLAVHFPRSGDDRNELPDGVAGD